ncbi:MAG: hypothetical protein HY392_05605 [Candidatus Diapherotrites archaeon]|nr:hypothetical protein [Candidatus Diapherotrites archaeon]
MKHYQFLAVLLLGAFFLLGCTQTQPPAGNGGDSNAPDSNGPGRVDGLRDLNVFTKGDKTISLNLDTNRLTLNFSFDFNSPSIDLNVLGSSCNIACNALDSNKWSVKMDVNNTGVYACYCTFTSCKDVDEGSQITRYCVDDKWGFLFESSVPYEPKVDFAVPRRLFNDTLARNCGRIFEGGEEPSSNEQTSNAFSCLSASFDSCTSAKGLLETTTIGGDKIVTFVGIKSLDENSASCSVLVSTASNDQFGRQGNFEKTCEELDVNAPFSSCPQ